MTAGASVKSYEAATLLLLKLAEVQVSTRHVNNLTTMVGEELAATAQQQTAAYRNQPLPRKASEPETPIDLAAVACDGGRMQTRQANGGRGVHDPHWRETKNAGFFRMKTQSFAEDPHPELGGLANATTVRPKFGSRLVRTHGRGRGLGRHL